jgi:hypothetical protein
MEKGARERWDFWESPQNSDRLCTCAYFFFLCGEFNCPEWTFKLLAVFFEDTSNEICVKRSCSAHLMARNPRAA